MYILFGIKLTLLFWNILILESNMANRSLIKLYSSSTPKGSTDDLIPKTLNSKKRLAEGDGHVDGEVEQAIKKKKSSRNDKGVQLAYPTVSQLHKCIYLAYKRTELLKAILGVTNIMFTIGVF